MVSPASGKISRVSPYSGYCYLAMSFRIRDYHPLWWVFPNSSAKTLQWILQSSTPSASTRFALFPVRSPLLGESRLISFPLATEMFHFARFAPLKVMRITTHWVAPFGYLRIKAPWQLRVAFRSLVRPSSPLLPKASTICSIVAYAFFVKYSYITALLSVSFQLVVDSQQHLNKDFNKAGLL